ncbi:uncharacterized protein BDW47DRAFT_124179 [Aspergillus candidus]|uniref:F-box domain-containing protein n=1 Tax=Aspergillus candidus TaxID=41067 RepID=A0A2I2FGW3_ASPCN|nr:hypothetical protein BDW47DRAFT_124179 [Aspergillus candidus]PLB39854.1 hypothetical protein BDW47DRAFT_124179 [Aspergillus candidus]
MGDYEVYCSLCGFILHDLYLEDASYDYRRSQLPAGEEEPPWLNEMQVIGENLDSLTLNKVYVSGPQTACAVGNSFDVDPGEDPRFPARGQVRYVDDGRADLCVYEWTVNGYIIPYHRACYHVLEKAIAFYSGAQPIDLDILYGVLRGIAASHPEIQAAKVLPGIDYGGAARAHRGGWWWPRQGYETYTWDPTDIPELRGYYVEMPLLQGADSGDEGGEKSAVRKPTSDPFAGLPTKVLHSILYPLPISSVAHLRIASPAVAHTKLSNDFWVSKLRHDMPWPYDLPTNLPASGGQLDWARMYQDLYLRSQDDFPFQMRGLVNRRRIWGICAQIAQPYAMAKRAEKPRQPRPPILDDLVASPMRPLRLPRVLAPRMGYLLLVDEMDGFCGPRPALTVCWSRTGTLAGFETRYINSQERETIETVGATAHCLTRNEVRIAADDWIRGFIITSRIDTNGEPYRSVTGLQVLFLHGDTLHLGNTTGDKRLLHAEGDYLFVGLTAQYSDECGITALSLLQARPHPQDTPARTLSQSQSHHPHAHTTITSKLWKALPPPTHLITERQPGFWPDNLDPSLTPMECLTFGLTETDLASITALSVDISLGGIQIQYSNQPPKSIGPRLTALKTMPIDGPSGERITALIVNGSSNNGVAVQTNHNRQLTVGSRVGGKHYFVPGEHQSITGLYGAWREGRMQWISTTFSSPNHPSPDRPTAQYEPPSTLPIHTPESENTIPWDISPPPTSYTPRGPRYGTHTWTSKYGGFENECPSPRTASAAWLDCSRGLPLERIKVVCAHPTRRLPFSPVGIGLFWAGGIVDWAGVSVSGDSTAASTTGDAPSNTASNTGIGTSIDSEKCPCYEDTQSPLSQEQKFRTPHFTREEWIVNDGSGGILHSLRLWTQIPTTGTGKGPLRGFQFVCTGTGTGTGSTGEGPPWGDCEGVPGGVVYFEDTSTSTPTTRQSRGDTYEGPTPEDKTHEHNTHEEEDAKDKAIGLKIFIDENDRPGVEDPSSVYSDPVMVCIQGLFRNA